VPDVPLDSAIADEQRAWSSPESLEYYRRRRQGVEDLYPSERFFLPDVVRQSASMLDVGCAAGGFSAIVKRFNPGIRYVGVDVTPEFVEAARVDHPDSEFVVGDGVHFATPPGSFDLVHASGVLHLNQHFGEIIRAMWRQTTRYLLCDLRLTLAKSEIGQMVSPFDESQPVSLPYIVLKVDEAVDVFKALDPKPASIRVKGYPQRASGAARLDNPDIVMAFFLIEKYPIGQAGKRPVHVDIDLHAG